MGVAWSLELGKDSARDVKIPTHFWLQRRVSSRNICFECLMIHFVFVFSYASVLRVLPFVKEYLPNVRPCVERRTP